MPTKFFFASVLGSDQDKATSRVARYLDKVVGFEMTGKVTKSSVAGHTEWVFQIANNGGNRNDLWVVLSSYGISLEKGVSCWQDVPGVGKASA